MVGMKLISAVMVVLTILPSFTKCAPIMWPPRTSYRYQAHGQQQVPYMVNQMKAMSNWLGRLHALLNENAPGLTSNRPDNGIVTFQTPTTAPRVTSKVQLAMEGWESRSLFTDGNPVSYSRYFDLEVAAPSGGVVLAFIGAKLDSEPCEARFAMNGQSVFANTWGDFYTNQQVGSHNLIPFCFLQMAAVDITHSVEVHLQVKLTKPVMSTEGIGMVTAVFPPPAFLSSVRANSESGLSNEEPRYQNLVHTIDITTDNALLIMAANGRINGMSDSGNTSLTYTIEGFSPTRTSDMDFGYYYVRSDSIPLHRSMPMNLYQLAVVERGKHIVQLEGQGSPFEMSYVTSQVTAIPVNQVQYKSAVSEWEVVTDPATSLSSTLADSTYTSNTITSVEVQTTSRSILVLTTTFHVTSCANSGGSHLFMINGQRAFPIVLPDGSLLQTLEKTEQGVWYNKPSPNIPAYAPAPGSMLHMARVEPGSHMVELVSVNYGPCQMKTTGAILQVGIVPEEYWYLFTRPSFFSMLANRRFCKRWQRPQILHFCGDDRRIRSMHVLIRPRLLPYTSIVPAKLQDLRPSPSFTKSSIFHCFSSYPEFLLFLTPRVFCYRGLSRS